MLRTLLGLGAVAAFATTANGQIVINEIRIDQPGADNDEYFELAGAPGTALTGLWYVVLGDTPGSGVVETALDLSPYSLNAAGLFVAAEDTWTGAFGTADVLLSGAPLNFENSDNVTHLLVTDFTASAGDDLDADDDGVLDSTPWTAVVDEVGLLEDPAGDALYTSVIVGPDGSFVPGHVYRHPGGPSALSSWNIGDFGGANDSAGGTNPIGAIPEPFGGSQLLLIDFGPAAAGDLHFVVSSSSGTAPGVFVGPVLVPLNPDALTLISINQANGAVFSGTFGLLDGEGRAQASIHVPAAIGLPGVVVDSVALRLNLLGEVVGASNPTTFTLIP